MREQLTNTNLATRLKTPGRREGNSTCRGNGATAARPCLPSVRSPSARPAGTAVLEAKIKTLQAEIVKLEAVVAGQRAELERERHGLVFGRERRLLAAAERIRGNRRCGATPRARARRGS
jgi:hypothetical protein